MSELPDINWEAPDLAAEINRHDWSQTVTLPHPPDGYHWGPILVALERTSEDQTGTYSTVLTSWRLDPIIEDPYLAQLADGESEHMPISAATMARMLHVHEERTNQ